MKKQARAFMIAAMIAVIALGMAIFASAEETTATASMQGETTSQSEASTAFDYTVITKSLTFLAWIVGPAGAIAGFLGWKTKKGIRDDLNSLLKKLLANELSDNDTLDNLKRSVAREKHAKKIQVLFAATNENDLQKVESVCSMFDEHKYSVSKETVDAKNLLRKTKNKNIIVLCVPKTEDGEKREEPDLIYGLLARLCNANTKMQCILYCPNYIRINPALKIDGRAVIDDGFVTTVQNQAKLRETLYMLLYFSPLNED